MGKAVGILLFVIAIWLGLQYYTGGGTSPRPDPVQRTEQRAVSPAQRVGQRVTESLANGAEREERLIPE